MESSGGIVGDYGGGATMDEHFDFQDVTFGSVQGEPPVDWYVRAVYEPQETAAFGSPAEISVGVLADSGDCECAGVGVFAPLTSTDDVVGVVAPLRHQLVLLRSR